MWGNKIGVAEQRPIEVDGVLDDLGAVDLQILRILEEAGVGQGLRHARRLTDDLAVMLVGSGTSTFRQFDESLERLEAQHMIGLDKEGFASLSERGRDRPHPRVPPVQHANAGSAPVPALA